MEGVGSLISIVTVTFTAPPLLFAQIVYTVEVEFARRARDLSREWVDSSPAGNAGSDLPRGDLPTCVRDRDPIELDIRVPTRLVGVEPNSPVVH